MIKGQREGDMAYISYDGKSIMLQIDAAPIPGITDKVMKSGIRLSIESTLGLIDELKTNIRNALGNR